MHADNLARRDPADDTRQLQPLSRYATIQRNLHFLYWHDHMIDYILVNPAATNRELASYVGRSYSFVCMVRNSDAFRARYEQRKQQHGANLADKVNGKLADVAVKSLDILLERLEEKRDVVQLGVATDIADRVLQRLGYGAKPTAPASVNVNVNQQVAGSIAPETLAEARGLLRSVEAQRASAPVRTLGGGVASPHSPAIVEAEAVGDRE